MQERSVHVVNCSRCGEPCKIAESSTEEARLLKFATAPETSGFCPDCATTDFFKHQSPLGQIMEGNPAGKAMLLDPRVQQQFANILAAGKSDAKPTAINWQRVHDNWELPFKAIRKTRTRKGKDNV